MSPYPQDAPGDIASDGSIAYFYFIMRFALLLPVLCLVAMMTTPRTLAQTDTTIYYPAVDSLKSGPLISSATAMETAWDLVKNPFADTIAGGAEEAELVRRGFNLFTQTPKYASRFSGNDLSCGHCHLNAGQREKALPLVGVSGAFPELNKRAGKVFSLEDRITGCFLRSMNASGTPAMLSAHEPGIAAAAIEGSDEVRAIAAYIDWLSADHPPGSPLPWRGLNEIPDSMRLPMDALDSARGEGLFQEKCSNCHGEDGQGLAIGDIKAGPLWGPASWNDGAGAARVYTLAGMIRHMMPYIDPGGLTDEEAQQIAFFICAQPRPVFPFKSSDYRNGKIPPDAVYYKRGE